MRDGLWAAGARYGLLAMSHGPWGALMLGAGGGSVGDESATLA